MNKKILEEKPYDHYCPDWDYEFITIDSEEFESCLCFKNREENER